MRRTGRQRAVTGFTAFELVHAGSVSQSVNTAFATNGAGRQIEHSMDQPAGATAEGNVSASGVPLGRHRGVASKFSQGRYYFGPQADPVFNINAGEDFTISALVTSTFGSGNRAFFCGTSLSNGGIGTIAMGMQFDGLRQIALAPGNGSGANLNWTGPTIQTGVQLRYDLCRVNGLFFAFFDGQPATGGSGVPYASNGTHIGAGRFSIGGVGEYTGGSYGGQYGDRWGGTVEAFVILKGVGLYTGAFDPFDPRPFQRDKLRR